MVRDSRSVGSLGVGSVGIVTLVSEGFHTQYSRKTDYPYLNTVLKRNDVLKCAVTGLSSMPKIPVAYTCTSKSCSIVNVACQRTWERSVSDTCDRGNLQKILHYCNSNSQSTLHCTRNTVSCIARRHDN